RPSLPALSISHDLIAEELRKVCQIMDGELFSDSAVVNDLCGHLRSYRGKMLRPALLLLSAKACGGIRGEHLTLAAVLELVHMATLVHDDVLDEADLRRRQPTIHRLQGNEAAVLLGDYLISHAFHLCSTVDAFACQQIGARTNTVCEGELQQVAHRGDWNLSLAQYLDIITRKTAALTGAACMLGAKYAEAPETTMKALEQYGLKAGIAFQITDDVLDIVGSQERMGKTLGRDLDERKPTLPLIHALIHATPGQQALIRQLLLAPSPDRARLATILRETGSIKFALQEATEYVRSAMIQLDELPSSDSRAALTQLAATIVTRDL
ncbi:MAG: polyprenyl synthetase family protein, partial [Phycisphaerae bacterium]|nr:polyprenyl synthetase family protein [Phycisphaerae bacterium]